MCYIRKKYRNEELRDYSALFSRNYINNIFLRNDFSFTDYCIKKHDNRAFAYNRTYREYYNYVYKVLSEHYNNEYFYKNEFINSVFKEMSEHESTGIFSEFRIMNTIADIVCFNGHSVVYEVKTELDNDDRLESQLNEYLRLFNEVNIIVPVSKVQNYKSLPPNVGILVFDKDKRLFSWFKKARINYVVDSKLVMQVLHTQEYKAIVKSYYGKEILDSTNDFTQFNVCSKLIEKIPTRTLNTLFVQTLKKRAGIHTFFSNRYSLFNQALLARKFNPLFKRTIETQLNRNIHIQS